MSKKSLDQYLSDITMSKTASAGNAVSAATDLNFIDKLAATIADVAKESATEAGAAAAAATAAQTLENRPETAAAKAGVKVLPGNAGDELALQALMEVIGPEGAPAGAELSQEVPVNAQPELPVVTDLDGMVKSPNDFSKSEAAVAMELASEAAKVASATGDINDGIEHIEKNASAEYVPAIVEAMGEILDGEKTASDSEVKPELVEAAVEIIKNAGLADKVIELSKQGADCSDAELCKLAEDILNTEKNMIDGQKNLEKIAADAKVFGTEMAKVFLSELKKNASDTPAPAAPAAPVAPVDDNAVKIASAVDAVKSLVELVKAGKLA